ncbi:CCA tRNA nucleotidyltransferase [Oryzibacter oryziterrae]|uniref:CCA tRNA nucleotidyltransferase n=1 Tax=Oryzibacter oryziterrae TaxID=2766474 RepID=UPI001F17BE82|nr:CCA tRNA nucleotidyltransferase [Oryzibacter oryziterrae]
MSDALRLSCDFLADPDFLKVVDAIEREGDVARVVGGAVRNVLMGEPVADIDIATTARPEVVAERARAQGLKVVPTGIDHGTVTVVAGGHPFEVTTLRADVETDGRRAVVAFTGDWAEDARRRDFTMNAIYMDRTGLLHDPVQGIDDARARRVRFIGDAGARIAEDYLRILRFFRFHARYGAGAPDSVGLAACVALRAGLGQLSRERIGAETRKILVAPGAVDAVRLMEEGDILTAVLEGQSHAARFSALAGLWRAAGITPSVEAGLAVLAEAPDKLAAALRLSNAEKARLEAILTWRARLAGDGSEAAVRLAVHRAGNDVATAALLACAADRGETNLPSSLDLARHWRAPAFPLRAADLIARGFEPGPAVGAELRRQEAAWIAAGYPVAWPWAGGA